MDASGRRQWLWIVPGVGLVYLVIGQLFALLANGAGSDGTRVAWRLAAWALSAVVFTAHTGHERIRLRSVARTAALRASSAAGVGAFLIAVVVIVRGHGAPGHAGARALALVLFPVVTMLPAFVVAFGLAAAIRVGTPERTAKSSAGVRPDTR
jgi:hypothetical protein